MGFEDCWNIDEVMMIMRKEDFNELINDLDTGGAERVVSVLLKYAI